MMMRMQGKRIGGMRGLECAESDIDAVFSGEPLELLEKLNERNQSRLLQGGFL